MQSSHQPTSDLLSSLYCVDRRIDWICSNLESTNGVRVEENLHCQCDSGMKDSNADNKEANELVIC